MAEATNRLQNFQQFLQKLMGNEYSNQMVDQLVKLNPYESKQSRYCAPGRDFFKIGCHLQKMTNLIL